MLVKIQVTNEDIRDGVPKWACSCPVSCAIQRALGAKRVLVGMGSVIIPEKHTGKDSRPMPKPFCKECGRNLRRYAYRSRNGVPRMCLDCLRRSLGIRKADFHAGLGQKVVARRRVVVG